jgi:Zn/Cd-binding protein ZinT
MKRILLLLVFVSSLIYADMDRIKIDGNSITISRDGREYTIPTYNINGVTKYTSKREYKMYWYYHMSGSVSSYISKSDFEKVKRLIGKVEEP